MALSTLIESKNQLIETLVRLAELAKVSGVPSLHDRLQADRIPRLREERLVLVVLGEFNHGKTTFVNALLGGNVLPVGITPTTALIHEVRYGTIPKAEVVFRAPEDADISAEHTRLAGGKRQALEWTKLGELVVGGNIHPDEVLRVEIEYPAEMLRDRITLVDTPGVNDLNLQRAEITYGYVPRADAVVFLLDAGQILKESERTFLRDKLLGAGRDRIVFAINKSDILDEAERTQVFDYAKKQISQIVPGAPVLLISSEKKLAGDEAASGFTMLQARLNDLLGQNRLRMLVDYGADEGQRVADMLYRSLAVRRRALTMSADELERRIQAAEKDLEVSRAQVAERQKMIQEEVSAVRAVARRDLFAFAEEFANAIAAQVEKQSADDTRRFLASYIEDTWKQWLEREAVLVGSKLEALAENIVAIVNEDARDAAAKVKAFLGDSATNLDIKVDTLAYDVSVFALGAFGMSVMVLSNLLVGGLLTLAAPVLAILFKDRVDKEVKKKAAENAPEVIRAAARKIEPELVGGIDRFGQKLTEFLNTATEELRRSVVEVLHSTRTAHAQAKADAAPPVAEVERNLHESKSLADQVAALRARVWEDAAKTT